MFHGNIYVFINELHCEKCRKFSNKLRSIGTSNKHHHHRPHADHSCFQMCALCAFCPAFRIFNNLPRSLINLKNEKAELKVTLINTHSIYSVDEFSIGKEDP